MTRDLCRILLIEDEPTTVKLIQRLLLKAPQCSLARGLTFTLTQAQDLEETAEKLAGEKFDLILLSLEISVPPGLNILVKTRELASHIPIVVQTTSNDEKLVVKAFQLGADGYIQLNNIDSSLLVYQIRVAIERQQYILNLKHQQQEEEFRELEQLIKGGQTSITAKMFGSEAIRQSIPDIFQELVQNYGDLLDLALEEQAYKVEHNLSERLRSLADKLGFLKASPRDVVDIHTTTLRKKNQDVTLAKAQAYVSEGRLMVLELMGYLVSFYRKYYIGLSNIKLFNNTQS
ncbi:MAG: response regulator [Microcystis sp. M015S2]|uniref:response regulator n=1 Tax=unclassified Microcystis TaxID=2643300 RepID=UPI0025911407|nr:MULTISPECIES: response regulator [unclassified Microcystis]MCA2708303.1 response regulator [Microcystis sp. M025S2]MCA2744803.1 response regulator [Microcystis sp. M015S2]MCA2757856.1 response regulator [Microcystis sp. M145S2]